MSEAHCKLITDIHSRILNTFILVFAHQLVIGGSFQNFNPGDCAENTGLLGSILVTFGAKLYEGLQNTWGQIGQ